MNHSSNVTQFSHIGERSYVSYMKRKFSLKETVRLVLAVTGFFTVPILVDIFISKIPGLAFVGTGLTGKTDDYLEKWLLGSLLMAILCMCGSLRYLTHQHPK